MTCKHLLNGAPDCVFCHRDQLKQENERLRRQLETIQQLLKADLQFVDAAIGDQSHT